MSEITAQRASELRGDGAQFIDVREDYEWDAGHIAGARHIELNELTAAVGELDRERPVVVYCRSGERSGMAADALEASGWDAHSIAGGLLAWAEEGQPLEPENGTVVERRPGAVT